MTSWVDRRRAGTAVPNLHDLEVVSDTKRVCSWCGYVLMGELDPDTWFAMHPDAGRCAQ